MRPDLIATHGKEAKSESLRTGVSVRLRSGGPVMTVIDIGRETHLVWCRWINDDGVMAEATFPAAALSAY